jgi:endonuclease YncB( thermonuclease family)
MVMSKSTKAAPNRRGLVMALIVASLMLFAGIEWMKQTGQTPEIISRVVGQVYTPPSYDGKPYADLSGIDKETMRHQSRGAKVGRVRVSTGDVLQMDNWTFRLWGTREIAGEWYCGNSTDQMPCAATAQQTLNAMVDGGLVACYDKGLDRWDFPIARCYRGVRDLGAWMIEAGASLPEEVEVGDNGLKDYYMLQSFARSGKRGAWSSAE